jgi:hypothetical protein
MAERAFEPFSSHDPGTWHSALEQTNEILVMSKLEDPSSESAAVGPFSAVYHKYHQFQQIR